MTPPADDAPYHYPSREQIHELVAARTGDRIAIPVVRELDAAGIDPLAAFALLAEGETHAALLETSEAASGDADFSVVIPRAARMIHADAPDVLDAVRAATCDEVAEIGIELPRFVGGCVGMLGHEHVAVFEPRVPRAAGAPAIETPDAAFLVVDELVAFDHRAGRVLAICTITASGDDDRAALDAAHDAAVARLDELAESIGGEAPRAATCALVADAPIDAFDGVGSNLDPGRYEAMVRAAKQEILAGECVQVVVSQRFDRTLTADPLLAYRAMRSVSPAPYHALLRLGDVTIVGASPEQLVGVMGDERVVTHPIAGTRPRGATRELDVRLEQELLADPKERAEHMMLVDLGRNDVGRVSRPGSVEVARLCEVERYSHVMHLVSRVEGELRAGLHPVDALAAAFPAGTLTGAPKVRAMQLIARLEPDRRGAYGGVVGYVGHGRTMDMAITIRT
ncbi:MAG: anthranilate synthase component I family protein, partial [Thermoleophilia bacterium]|nr:anthranilate synthase component I family protein [Thermoleophilia bacterium]